MKQTFKSLIAAATVASIVVSAGVASAANTSAEAKCHAAIAKNVTKYQAGLIKNLAACHKGRNSTKILASVDCNTATGADTKGKRGDNIAKVAGAIAKACELDDPMETAAVLALYPRCPSPVKTLDDAGATTGIDTWAELANCLVGLSESYVNKIGAEVLGAPTATDIGAEGLTKGQQACVNGMGKALSGLAKAAGSLNKCQAGVEKALTGLDLTATCLSNGDVTSAINEAQANFDAVVADACGAENMPGQADFVTLNSCGETVGQLQTCGGDRTAFPTIRGLVAATQEFPNDGAGNLTCSAGGADVIINAGDGVQSTNTRLDSGYSGFAHGVDVIDQYKGRVLITGCDSDCENCSVTMDTKAGNCRCESDASRDCNVINGNDTDAAPNGCAGLATQACQCMFGPPLPLSAGGTSTCVVNRFASDFSGTTGAIGEYNVLTSTRALVHLGSLPTPCPTCNGDASPRSGNHAGGTCSGGPRNGLACDEDARHSNFGPTSFDCPPSLAGNVSGSGLGLALTFKSGSASLTAGITNPTFCPTGASGACHCSACTLDTSVGCSSNADCAAVAAGTCGVDTGALPNGNDPQQNACDGGPSDCVADPANPGMGQCNTGPIEDFCDGLTKGNGGGIIACSNNGDCAALNASCPGGNCGNCSITTNRSCFLPTVSATGIPGIYNSEGVSTFCSSVTSSGPVNTSAGLPGPGRVRLDFDFNLWCDGSTTNQFQLPLGSNCNP